MLIKALALQTNDGSAGSGSATLHFGIQILYHYYKVRKVKKLVKNIFKKMFCKIIQIVVILFFAHSCNVGSESKQKKDLDSDTAKKVWTHNTADRY